MTSLLFLLFLITIVLALSNKERLSFFGFGLAMLGSLLWFFHHASSKIDIPL